MKESEPDKMDSTVFLKWELLSTLNGRLELFIIKFALEIKTNHK